jgi:hypothetical protein
VLGPSGRGAVGADTKARPSGAMPRKSRRREGRRERESVRACTKEQSSGRTQERGWVKAHARGFQSGGRHLDSTEAISLRGAVAEADLRPARCKSAETPTAEEQRAGDPGAREMFEEGSLPQGESFARALSARATEHGVKTPQR